MVYPNSDVARLLARLHENYVELRQCLEGSDQRPALIDAILGFHRVTKDMCAAFRTRVDDIDLVVEHLARQGDKLYAERMQAHETSRALEKALQAVRQATDVHEKRLDTVLSHLTRISEAIASERQASEPVGLYSEHPHGEQTASSEPRRTPEGDYTGELSAGHEAPQRNVNPNDRPVTPSANRVDAGTQT
ncbi:MAG: hypothetical protein Q9162_002026 [Coniocarpon cinnabarinum]